MLMSEGRLHGEVWTASILIGDRRIYPDIPISRFFLPYFFRLLLLLLLLAADVLFVSFCFAVPFLLVSIIASVIILIIQLSVCTLMLLARYQRICRAGTFVLCP